MSEATYKAAVLCKNCGFVGEIEINRGTEIKDMSCPECGCSTIDRDYNSHLRNRPPRPRDWI